MIEQDPQPTGLAGIILAIRDNWIVALVGALVVLVPGGLLIATQQADYRSESVVGLVPTRSQSDAFLRAVAQQLPTYLTSPEVTARVGEKVGLTGPQVLAAISIEIPAATLNLTTTALYSDAETSAQIANEIAGEALRNTQYKEFFAPVLLSPATRALKPTGFGKAVLLPLLAILAAVVGTVAALVARDLRVSRSAASD